MIPEPIPLAKGQVLGRYELLAPVARGGMGQVWLARLRGARGFQKLVAIKTVLPARGDAGRMERMLFDEARIASLIQHSNVAQTHELGEHAGTLYLVMEWIDGEPLSYLLTCAEQRGGMPLSVAVNIVAQTLRGLHAAHELVDDAGSLLGVVHRDVSPHNVLVSYEGVAKLLDFGIAKAFNEDSSSTQTGEIKGKFSYMAPEQILGEPIDRRADIFSVGIMLYTVTTGRHPFKNHNSAGVLHSISSQEPAPRPSLTKPGYSRTLEAVVLKALEKSPDKRYASAEEMRLALQRAVPHAFNSGVEEQLRGYLNELVGERAALKREALRKIALAGEDPGHGSGSLKAAGATAQSASSLRAITVDTQSPLSDPPARHSQIPTLRPEPGEEPEIAPPRSRFQRPVLGALALAAALAIGVLSLHKSAGRSATAASPSAGMVELSSTRPSLNALRPSAPEPLAPASAGSALPSAPNAPGARTATSVGSAAPSASAVAVRPAPQLRHTPATPAKPRLVAKDSDLIAPDYAK
jgi:serine/threonine-protein kinase